MGKSNVGAAGRGVRIGVGRGGQGPPGSSPAAACTSTSHGGMAEAPPRGEPIAAKLPTARNRSPAGAAPVRSHPGRREGQVIGQATDCRAWASATTRTRSTAIPRPRRSRHTQTSSPRRTRRTRRPAGIGWNTVCHRRNDPSRRDTYPLIPRGWHTVLQPAAFLVDRTGGTRCAAPISDPRGTDGTRCATPPGRPTTWRSW